MAWCSTKGSVKTSQLDMNESWIRAQTLGKISLIGDCARARAGLSGRSWVCQRVILNVSLSEVQMVRLYWTRLWFVRSVRVDALDLITHLVYGVNRLLFRLSLGAVVTKDHYNSWDWEEVTLPIKCSCNTLTRSKAGALVWFGQSPPGYCVSFPLLLLLWWFRIIKLQAQGSPGLLIWFCLFPHPDFLNIFLVKMRFCIKSLKQTVRPHPAAPPRLHWA